MKKYLLKPYIEKSNFENHEILTTLNNIFKQKGTNFKLSKKDNVILILSGGLDSVSLWFYLLNKYKCNVYPLHIINSSNINYGQIKSINFFSNLFKKKFPKLFHPIKYIVTDKYFNFIRKANIKNLNYLINNLTILANGDLLFPIPTNPNRLIKYLSFAYDYLNYLNVSKNLDINTIILGFTPDDSKIIRENTLTTLKAFNLAFSLTIYNWKLKILAPFDKRNNFYITKKQLVKYALKHNLPLEKTWSCNNNSLIHCGYCPSCRLRQWAFNKANFKDKTRYLTSDRMILFIKGVKSFLKDFILNLIKLIIKNKNLKKLNFKKKLIISINNEIHWTKRDEKFYIINKDGFLLSLNYTASLIFDYILKKQLLTFLDLLYYFRKKYGTNKKKENDLKLYIKDLLKHKIITIKQL